jgi:hypothetical protein
MKANEGTRPDQGIAMFDPYHKWLGISPKDEPPDHDGCRALTSSSPTPM